jgi:hypothetical protein
LERANLVKSVTNVHDLEQKIGAGQIEEVMIQVSILVLRFDKMSKD